MGWAIEIDPETKKVVDHVSGLAGGDKLWALGNFKHENVVVHKNKRTEYQGVDDSIGYLYKFIASAEEDLSAGTLYVYKGSKSGSGEWIKIKNSVSSEQNTTLSQSAAVSATVFNGIEDVEINPIDNKIYLAVKGESRVYRFDDSDPISGTMVNNFETYVGGMNYDIDDGTDIHSEPWGWGNDNLAFDDLGNLWVLQDGGRNYIWLVKNGHTQENPQVEIFARAPAGSEPTGITFSPDSRYLFMSIQHPSPGNDTTTQPDAFSIERAFDRDVSIVIARSEHLNNNVTSMYDAQEDIPRFKIYPNPSDGALYLDIENNHLVESLMVINFMRQKVPVSIMKNNDRYEISTGNLANGTYFLKISIGKREYFKKIILAR